VKDSIFLYFSGFCLFVHFGKQGFVIGPRLALNSWSSCLSLPNAGITDMCSNAQLKTAFQLSFHNQSHCCPLILQAPKYLPFTCPSYSDNHYVLLQLSSNYQNPFFFLFYYSYAHTRLRSFLPPAPTPSLTTHSAPSLFRPPPQYPAETILPLFLILL
jgi:hypothetical protein